MGTEVVTQAVTEVAEAVTEVAAEAAVAAEKVSFGLIAGTFVRGLGTVFIGLIALIFIIKIMGALCGKFVKEAPKPAAAAKKAAPAPAQEAIANRGEFIAAVSAAIATVMGKDVGAIRIVSVKKVD